jgi:hypothetical protein
VGTAGLTSKGIGPQAVGCAPGACAEAALACNPSSMP